MRNFLVSVSVAAMCLTTLPVSAQQAQLYPDSIGHRVKCNAAIEMKKGYLSGVCMLVNDGGVVRGSIFNEFGISAIDFTYYPEKDKVKLGEVIRMLNRWYIRKVLKKDLRLLINNLRQGIGIYRDEKYNIEYKFTPLNDETEERPVHSGKP